MQSTRSSSVAILGVPVDNVSMDDVLHSIEQMILDGRFHQIATANVDFLINSVRDQELHEVLCRCDMVVPDGMPLVWASRWMGAPLQERVSGSDLVPRLAELSSRRGYGIFLLGANDAVSEKAAEWMRSRFPGTNIVGRYSPPFAPLDEMDHEDILARVESAAPDILLVALGNPKQEKWLAMHSHRLRVPVCIGIGGTLDLLAGQLTRAPRWMQTHGLEWLYRMYQEPARLAIRYANNAVGLAQHLPIQLLAAALPKLPGATGCIESESLGATTILRVHGAFTGWAALSLEQLAREALDSGSHAVIDFSGAADLGADALGALVRVCAAARRRNRELWLTGLRLSLRCVLRAAQLGSVFRTAPEISDALRRIAPAELQISIESGRNWAVCRIGGRSFPLRSDEVEGVCQQILHFLEASAFTTLAQSSAATAHQGD